MCKDGNNEDYEESVKEAFCATSFERIVVFVMGKLRLIVRLKGGLGNQMFQYAAGRALAIRNDMQLILDTNSGFIRDKVYRRTFSLGVFSIHTQKASFFEQLPFWFEQGCQKCRSGSLSPILNRPWGAFLNETELRYLDEIANYRPHRNAWMEGYWQSEEYFTNCKDIIGHELALPVPREPQFLSIAKTIEACDSVAVGVRLFEEVPGFNKSGLVPLSFYEDAANLMTDRVKDPTFFIFCTTDAAVRDKLKLPGMIHYVTHDNGYEGTPQRLWLISRCHHHVLSNSSFYWWGAWLAEQKNQGNVIIACDLFQNRDTIPARWIRYAFTP